MDAYDKLWKKISRSDQESLLIFFREINDPAKRKFLDIKKLSGGSFYRGRKGKFRVIFHIEHGQAVIDALRMRNEKTYRDI